MDKQLHLFLIFLLISGCSKKSPDGIASQSSTNFGLICQKDDEVRQRAIYGSDNRLDWFESPGLTKMYWAKATVALISKNNLIDKAENQLISAPSYRDAVDLCPGHPFGDQPSAAYCSGFLVSEDLIITAGHCVRDLADCLHTRFVFDYAKHTASQSEFLVPTTSVYNCAELKVRKTGVVDYAVIRLDRKVNDRTPLNVRRSGSLRQGEQVMLIGHPLGLPSKIADGGFIQSVGDKIVASVDAFAANSGSAIFNSQTGLVEGLLVAGESDFSTVNGCRVEAICDANCTGEIITPIAKVLSDIPTVTYPNPICD